MMSDKAGFIFLHRKLLDSVIWKLSTSEQRSILIAILLLASHKPNKWEWKGKQFMVMPGQFVTSAKSLCKASGTGISRQNVRTALARFKKLEFLTIKPTKSGSLISIIKWADYQNTDEQPNQEANHSLTTAQPSPNHHLTTINNVNNVNNEKKETYSSDFLQFWQAYPKKVDKGTAYEYWLEIKPDNGTFALIMIAIKNQRECDEWCRNNGQYIPKPVNWLSARRWEDEIEKQEDLSAWREEALNKP